MTGGTKLDLTLIDETYGDNSDLYEDVLRISTTANQDDIQLAYFDRRSELFTMLAKIDASSRGSGQKTDQKRFETEKKMDSIVYAVRILADPVLRKQYNGIRQERTGIGLANTTPLSRNSSASRSFNRKNNIPRAVTPPDDRSPPGVTTAAPSESKNWIQNTFSASLFSSNKSLDDGDEDRRKSKRKQKSSTSMETNGEEKEKRSLFGRKKKKKKKQVKDERGVIIRNDSITTYETENSVTDQEEANRRNARPSNNVSPQEAVRRGRSQHYFSTDDDTTRRDDDTRTFLGDDGETFATGSVYSKAIEDTGCGDGGGLFGCISGSRAVQRIANEISGACDDTLTSFDQVFNAFTLTDKDIKAVRKKIDRAERQLNS